MTELDGFKVFKNSSVEAEIACTFKVHLKVDDVKLGIPNPDFRNSELHFVR
jgi:hypothetical protein